MSFCYKSNVIQIIPEVKRWLFDLIFGKIKRGGNSSHNMTQEGEQNEHSFANITLLWRWLSGDVFGHATNLLDFQRQILGGRHYRVFGELYRHLHHLPDNQ